MKQKKEKFCGKDGFEKFYSDLYKERWQLLKNAFLEKNNPVEYFVPGSEKSYFLDSASVFASLCLPVKNAEKILDLCAAPGGKSIVIASRMDKNAILFSNERSFERKKRLQTSIKSCLPENINSRIKISCSDGAVWCKNQSECFDRILLDAPCSSERHVFLDEKYLNEWSPSRIKTVTIEQWALLSSAYRLLKVGGFLLYSTCAICPDENDMMMERLVKKFNKNLNSLEFVCPTPDFSEISSFVKMELPDFEKTQYGYEIFPDKQNGSGPIYFSLIKKKNSILS